MSLLTVIDNVPLYDTIREAKIWAKQYNLTGYHIHFFNGILGYMGGENHAQITSALAQGIQTALNPIENSVGNFAVTDSEIQFYQSLAQQNPQSPSQQENIQIAQPNQTPTQPNLPESTPQSTPMSQPSIPNYTPPSTGGSSGSSGGGY